MDKHRYPPSFLLYHYPIQTPSVVICIYTLHRYRLPCNTQCLCFEIQPPHTQPYPNPSLQQSLYSVQLERDKGETAADPVLQMVILPLFFASF